MSRQGLRRLLSIVRRRQIVKRRFQRTANHAE
jgi:hypothetical protein